MKATASNQYISWFFNRFKEEALELNPDFQRKPVWQQPEKDYLIETILLELPIPEIYMLTRITPSGESIHVIVDGQQRLRAILEFVTGELTLKNTPTGYDNIKTFNDLNDDQKQRFWRYPLVVRDLEESSEEDVRGLFERLNKYSYVLNEQEMRNARFKGVFLKTIENVGENSFWTGSGIFSSNDFRRMRDLEFISIIMVSLIGGIFHRTERLDEFYANYEQEFDEATYYFEKLGNVLDIIDAIFPNIRRSRWSNKANFFTLFLCIDHLNTDISNKELLQTMETKLNYFDSMVVKAKNNPEEVDEIFVEYNDAATYGTNDKEKRLRRFNILSGYLASELEIQGLPFNQQ